MHAWDRKAGVLCLAMMLALWTGSLFRLELPLPRTPIFTVDKWTHLAVYGLLASGWMRVLAGKVADGVSWRVVGMAVLLTTVTGAIDEGMQALGRVRSPEWADFVADTLGAVIAALAWKFLPWYRQVLLIRPFGRGVSSRPRRPHKAA